MITPYHIVSSNDDFQSFSNSLSCIYDLSAQAGLNLNTPKYSEYEFPLSLSLSVIPPIWTPINQFRSTYTGWFCEISGVIIDKIEWMSSHIYTCVKNLLLFLQASLQKTKMPFRGLPIINCLPFIPLTELFITIYGGHLSPCELFAHKILSNPLHPRNNVFTSFLRWFLSSLLVQCASATVF